MYVDGVATNLGLAARLYGADYTVRVYHNFRPGSDALKALCDVYCPRKEAVDLCNVNQLGEIVNGFIRRIISNSLCQSNANDAGKE